MGVGTVPVQLDRERNIRFDHNALADLDMALMRGMGVTVIQAFENAGEDGVPRELISFAGVRAMLWAGLKHEDRSLTLDAVGTMMSQQQEEGGDFKALSVSVWEALAACGIFNKSEEKTEGKTEPANV